METFEEAIRPALDHMYLIKAHLLSLKRGLDDLEILGFSPAGIVVLRRSMLDMRMVVEELMLLSVSAHKRAGQQVTRALQQQYRADKKMKILKELNPKFFPDAIDIVPADESGVGGQFVSVEGDYLTADLAKRFYHDSDNLLHASCELLEFHDFERYVKCLRTFYELSERLLRTFEVDISGSGFSILGHLNLGNDSAPAAFDARLA